MRVTSATDLRKNLSAALDQVIRERAPLLVTRGGKGDCVLLSAEEFASWKETIHLLRSPRNAKRLLGSVRDLAAGKAAERALVEPEPAK